MKPVVAAVAAALTGLLCLGAAGSAGAGAATPAARVASRPPISKWLIPFGHKRKREMAAYSLRHYGALPVATARTRT